MSDIEQRLREAEERLAMEIAVEMELHAAISTTTKAKAEAIAKFLAPAFASLRSKLEEAEGALTLLLKMHEAHHNNPVHAAARRTLASLREG